MGVQQVVGPSAKAAIFLTLVVEPGAEDAVGRALTEVSGITRDVATRAPDGGLMCVVGIGANLWDRLHGADTRPRHLHPFAEIRGPRHVAPATEGDLLIHLRAQRADLCFELAARLTGRLRGLARVVDEVHGFAYFDERDLIGFVDGTENPEGDEAVEAVTIGSEDAAYAGGSYVLVQKYLTDLETWDALPVEEQEKAIGRTKLDDVEMPEDVMPATSHVALNAVKDEEGNALEILRQNMPFGRVGAGEFGTYFIGYAADPGIIERMLRNMFLGDPPGTTDRLLDFTTAHTGALFFVPSAAFLDDPAPRPREA